MARKEHHVVPNSKKGGWDVKTNNAEKSIKHFERKSEAEDFGRDLSRRHESEFIVHKKDGTIQKCDSHGNDPCPPKDKR